MARKIPKSLSQIEWPKLWWSRRFLAGTLRISRSTNRKSPHFRGGQSPHSGNKCRACGRSLSLLWDIDLRDQKIPQFVREGFSPATRLPFYICWQCLTTNYLVRSDDRINCLPFDCHNDPLYEGDSPFQDVPIELKRCPIKIHPIPSTIDGLLSLANIVGIESLDSGATNILEQYYGKSDLRKWDLPISQLGGLPQKLQGHIFVP